MYQNAQLKKLKGKNYYMGAAAMGAILREQYHGSGSWGEAVAGATA
jgi:hypothetical protein